MHLLVLSSTGNKDFKLALCREQSVGSGHCLDWTELLGFKSGLSNPTSYPTNHQQSHGYSCPESDFVTEVLVLHCFSHFTQTLICF